MYITLAGLGWEVPSLNHTDELFPPFRVWPLPQAPVMPVMNSQPCVQVTSAHHGLYCHVSSHLIQGGLRGALASHMSTHQQIHLAFLPKLVIVTHCYWQLSHPLEEVGCMQWAWHRRWVLVMVLIKTTMVGRLVPQHLGRRRCSCSWSVSRGSGA